MDKELHVSFGSQTDTGLVNEFNTDTVLEFSILKGHVFVVCDGRNGPAGHGALASKLIAESIKKYFFNRSYKELAKALTNAITYANISLYDQSIKDQKYNGIASTLAIVIYREGKLYYAYAGDSRIYLYRNNQLQPLTRDHVDDPQNAKDAELTVALGRARDIKFGVCKNPMTVNENDRILICTDGLTDQVSDDEIAEILGDDNKAPEHKCQSLIEKANEKGGTDCTSVQVIDFAQVIELQSKPKKLNLKPVLFSLLSVVVLAAVVFGGYKGYQVIKNRPVNEEPVVEMQQDNSQSNLKNIQAPVVDNKELNKNNQPVEKPKAATPAKETKPAQTNNVNNEPVYYNHIIKYGENLYRLSLRYNVTQQKLIDLNGKKATNLIAGSKLKIPVRALHQVKKGESFSVISDLYNTKIKLICTASNIVEGTPLNEGQVLIIPLTK